MLANNAGRTSKPPTEPEAISGRTAPSIETEEFIRDFAQRYWNGRYGDLMQAIDRVQSQRGSILPILRAEGCHLI